jgi:ABC-type antimicrobial peptide transport system permease subunit
MAGGLSLLAGVLLGGVAAIGPAWTAARLAPMEAMRVD